jgi:hypothetical protein
VRIVGQPDIFKLGHGETPFFLVYGAEVVIPPPEITMPPSPMFRHTTKLRMTSSDMMMSILSMNEDGK